MVNAEVKNTKKNSHIKDIDKKENEKTNYHTLIDLDKIDLLGNKKYVDVLENKVKTCNSKIIGLMGSWGSGKSSIIYTLKKRILSSSDAKHIFMIHDAWKYHGDSFKRSFILDLERNINNNKTKLKSKKCKKIFSKIIKSRNGYKEQTIEETLYNQRNYAENFRYINVGSLTVFTILIFWGIYHFLENTEFDYKILALPIFFSLLSFVLTSFNTFSRSSTLTTIKSPLSKPEEFERVFMKLISGVREEVKLVIVIDNIDRCTSDVAYDILSSIKTFFNSENTENDKKIMFIIPIDHLMLKNHLVKSFNYSAWDTNCFFKKIFDDVYYLNNYNTDHHIELAKDYCKENEISLSYSFFELIGKLGLNKPRDIIEFTKDVNEEITILGKSLDTQLVKNNDYIIAILYYLKQHNDELLVKISLTNNLYEIECEGLYKMCILYLTELPITVIRKFIIALENDAPNDSKELINIITDLDKENFSKLYTASPSKVTSLICNSIPEFRQKGLELLINHIVTNNELRHYYDICKAYSEINKDIKGYYFPESFIKFVFFTHERERHYFINSLVDKIQTGNLDFDLIKFVLIHCKEPRFLLDNSIWIIKNLTKEKKMKKIEEIPKNKLKLLNFQESFDNLFREFFSNQIEIDIFKYILTNSTDDYLSTLYVRNSVKLNIFEFFLLHANESSHIFINKESSIKFLSLINEVIIKYASKIKNDEYWTYYKNNGILSGFITKILESYNREEYLKSPNEITKKYLTCITTFMNLSIIISQESIDDTNLWYNFYDKLNAKNKNNEIILYDFFTKISKFKNIDSFKNIITDKSRLDWFEKDCKLYPKLAFNKIPEVFSQN